MKRKFFFLAGILIMALTLTFVIMGCENTTSGNNTAVGGNQEPGDSLILVKFTFSGAAGDSGSSQSIAVPQTQANVELLMSENIDTNSLEPYTAVYETMLGDKIRNITPSSFKLSVDSLVLVSDKANNIEVLFNAEEFDGIPEYTFTSTKPVSVTLSDIQSGYYNMLVFKFATESSRVGPKPAGGQPDTRPETWSEMSFDWPAGISKTDTDTWLEIMRSKLPEGTKPEQIKLQGNSLSIIPRLLEVFHYDNRSPQETKDLQQIIFAGETRKMAHQLHADELIADYPHLQLGGGDHANLVVPFSGITIPDNANAVRFEINWELDELIEQYEGPDGVPNTADDIFVLKNGWWNGFNIKAIIE